MLTQKMLYALKKKVLNDLLTNLWGLVVTFYIDYCGTYLLSYVTISKFFSTGTEYSDSETSFCILWKKVGFWIWKALPLPF